MTADEDFRNPDEAFAHLFRTERAESGLSQEDVAKAMSARGYDFHQQTVYKIESGKRRVSVGEAVALADSINVHVNALLWKPEETFSLAEELRDQVAGLVDELDEAGVRLAAAGRRSAEALHSLAQMQPDDMAVITLPGGKTVSVVEGARRLLASDGVPRLISTYEAVSASISADLRSTAHIHGQL